MVRLCPLLYHFLQVVGVLLHAGQQVVQDVIPGFSGHTEQDFDEHFVGFSLRVHHQISPVGSGVRPLR